VYRLGKGVCEKVNKTPIYHIGDRVIPISKSTGHSFETDKIVKKSKSNGGYLYVNKIRYISNGDVRYVCGPQKFEFKNHYCAKTGKVSDFAALGNTFCEKDLVFYTQENYNKYCIPKYAKSLSTHKIYPVINGVIIGDNNTEYNYDAWSSQVVSASQDDYINYLLTKSGFKIGDIVKIKFTGKFEYQIVGAFLANKLMFKIRKRGDTGDYIMMKPEEVELVPQKTKFAGNDYKYEIIKDIVFITCRDKTDTLDKLKLIVLLYKTVHSGQLDKMQLYWADVQINIGEYYIKVGCQKGNIQEIQNIIIFYLIRTLAHSRKDFMLLMIFLRFVRI